MYVMLLYLKGRVMRIGFWDVSVFNEPCHAAPPYMNDRTIPSKPFWVDDFGASVADPDPGSGAFLTPASGIRNGFILDP